MPFLKRAVKYDRTQPGIPCRFLDCECGHRLNLPIINGLPILAYQCLCGRQYNHNGWLLTDEAQQIKPEPHTRLRNFQLALLDAETESLENLEAAAEILDKLQGGERCGD